MKKQFSRALALSLLLFLASTGNAHGQLTTDTVASSDVIKGSWYFTVTSDSAPSGFRAMISFGDGGGVVASAQGDVLLNAPPGVPPIATAGHGAWTRTSRGEYVFSFRQIFYNADGSYAGGAKIKNRGSVDKAGMNMAGELSFEYYDADDQIVFTGTGAYTAVRIAAEAP